MLCMLQMYKKAFANKVRKEFFLFKFIRLTCFLTFLGFSGCIYRLVTVVRLFFCACLILSRKLQFIYTITEQSIIVFHWIGGIKGS
jgi:hypothetical protein